MLFQGLLLETMSFVDALPPLKMKQWSVITLLFVDALSVRRIPAVAPQVTGSRFLLQKVRFIPRSCSLLTVLYAE